MASPALLLLLLGTVMAGLGFGSAGRAAIARA
jgi:hypothetical protein